MIFSLIKFFNDPLVYAYIQFSQSPIDVDSSFWTGQELIPCWLKSFYNNGKWYVLIDNCNTTSSNAFHINCKYANFDETFSVRLYGWYCPSGACATYKERCNWDYYNSTHAYIHRLYSNKDELWFINLIDLSGVKSKETSSPTGSTPLSISVSDGYGSAEIQRDGSHVFFPPDSISSSTIYMTATYSSPIEYSYYYDSSIDKRFLFFTHSTAGNDSVYVNIYSGDNMTQPNYIKTLAMHDSDDINNAKFPSVIKADNIYYLTYLNDDLNNKSIRIMGFVYDNSLNIFNLIFSQKVVPPNVWGNSTYGNHSSSPYLAYSDHFYLFYTVYDKANALQGVYALESSYLTDYTRQYVTYITNNVSQASVGQTVKYRIWILNNESVARNVTVGITEGKWVATNGLPYTSSQPSDGLWGVCWCNKACFNDDKGDWVYLYLAPYEQNYVERTMFLPDCMYSFIGQKFDIAVGLYNVSGDLVENSSDTYLITKSYWKDRVEITSAPPTTTTTTLTTTTTIPTGVDAKIISYSVDDQNPTQDQEVTMRIGVKNNGTSSYNFAVGLSIGNTSFWCNRDCYTDGLGDYVYTGQISPDEMVWVMRKFKFHSWLYETHNYYTMKIGVYPTSYLPPSQAFDYITISNYFYIKNFEEKLNTYAMSAVGTPYLTSQGGQIAIRSYVLNNGSITWNYTLGMSIGLWSATNGTIYYTQQPTLIPPCNIECYTDCDKYDEKDVSLCLEPEWFFSYIPPDYTVPFERKFRIPDYFITNTTFDVAIAVWSKPPDEGGKLVSIVYFKNISALSTVKDWSVIYGEAGKYYIGKIGTLTHHAFGWDMSMTKAFIWFSCEFLLMLGVAYMLRRSGQGLGVPILATIFVLTLLGGIVRWIPSWATLIICIVVGLLMAKIMGIFAGGH